MHGTTLQMLQRVYRELQDAEENYANTIEAALPPGTVVMYVHTTSHGKVEGTVECVHKNGKETRVVISRVRTGNVSPSRYTINPASIILPRVDLLTTPQHPNTPEHIKVKI